MGQRLIRCKHGEALVCIYLLIIWNLGNAHIGTYGEFFQNPEKGTHPPNFLQFVIFPPTPFFKHFPIFLPNMIFTLGQPEIHFIPKMLQKKEEKSRNTRAKNTTERQN